MSAVWQVQEAKNHFSELIERAVSEGPQTVTRHGKPAGVLIGFQSEDDWFDYRLEKDPRFLRRIEQARAGIRSVRGIPLEDVDD